MTRLPDCAGRAARELRDCLEPWAYESTRRQALDVWRSHLAHAIAEDRTGVTHGESRYPSLYSRRDLSDVQIARAKRYDAALLAAYQELPEDYIGLLQWCERHALAEVA